MSDDQEVWPARQRSNGNLAAAEEQRWEAYLLKVKGDLRHHLALLGTMLAEPADSVDLLPETISELNLVRGMIDIYAGRSPEDLEDSKTGFSDLDLR